MEASAMGSEDFVLQHLWLSRGRPQWGPHQSRLGEEMLNSILDFEVHIRCFLLCGLPKQYPYI